MIKFCQPCDYRYKGRNVWINPADVVTITPSDNGYDECVITLRDGRIFTIKGSQDTIAEQLNQ